jgi:hypothetical protein
LKQELTSLRAELIRQPPPSPAAAANGPAPPQPARPPEATAQPAPAAKPEATLPPGASVQGDPAIHVWLNQRIEALEQERQSRWQKVMSFVLGK